MAKNDDPNLLKKIIAHTKEYGFVFPSSEIYDGLSATYDYGQYGVELKNNIRNYWWKAMVQMNENIVGLDAAIFMIYSLNGERCTSSSRLLVQDTIADTFEAKLAARVNNIKVGHPLDPATEIGPLIGKVHHDKVTSFFDTAKTDGAQIAAGGTVPKGAGY